MNKTVVALMSSILLTQASAGHAADKNKTAPTGLALQQIQARDFEAKVDTVFPSVMTVLQDSGYQIQAADKATGLITAHGSTKSKLNYNLLWGFGKKKKTPVVSAFIEQRGSSVTRVRLNFVISELRSNLYGSGSPDDEPITDPVIYKDAFEKIDKEIFVRAAMDAPAAPATPTATATAPVSTDTSGGAAATPKQ